MVVLDGFPILVTADLPRLEAFYRTALDAQRTFSFPGDGGADEYVTLDLGGTQLGIGRADILEANAGHISLWFYVHDVDDAYRRSLAAGGTAVSPPRDTPWGERVAEIRDPDGFLLYLGAQPD